MIRIRRPEAAPDVLSTRGRQLRAADLVRYARGDLVFTFERDVYGHADVKHALRAAQHDKCCFCESKVSHVAFGDVEHFRPKARCRRDDDDAFVHPGYFWLAYEWTNLLYCCEQCNRRYKGDRFPLADERTRARVPSDDISREEPMFIDPSAEDPARHIGFREEYPYAIDGSPRGEATWRALGLARPNLAERRRDHLQRIQALRDAFRLLRRKRDRESRAVAEEIDAQLRQAVHDQAEYAALTRGALAPLRRSRRSTEGPATTRRSPRGRASRHARSRSRREIHGPAVRRVT